MLSTGGYPLVKDEDALSRIAAMLKSSVGRCRLSVSKPELKARLVSAFGTQM